ncbi:Helix-turn-helix domain-containing protein [Sinosporangium album]|uniref:Helix-turn-helix domain-containing protein n=1 Tax=Sinosporangium album TaxID=504805 RepID=A0A1G7ZJX7_9ACTN|nr:helix-turn-helix transcriptional regulator [Sinosporangium album]SDH09052.1 Helix-turn-helix domain-containing protein [Sinosporangium album]
MSTSHSASSSAQAARFALASKLRELRLDAGLTARALAAKAGWHEAKTSRIEHGKKQPSEPDLAAWVQACGVPGQLAELIAELRAVDSAWLDWRRAEKAGLTRLNVAVRELYERTTLYRSYCQDVIPGLLQTTGYTTATLEAIRSTRRVAVDDVADAVAERMARQHILYEGNHRFVFILEAAALKYRRGGQEVMIGQLGHLLEAMSLPSVSLGVIPPDVERAGRWPVESFYVFDNAQANVELVSGFLTITQPREIAMYVEAFMRLHEIAVFGRSARVLIKAAMDALE